MDDFEDKIKECNLDIVEAADYIVQEEYLSAYWLSKSNFRAVGKENYYVKKYEVI